MSKSNWKGTSGWGAINDPTGALNGRVLVASAGITATNEDYLTSIVGTSTAFSAEHYSVYLDYAFPNYKETHPFVGGTLGLIARSSNFQGDPEKAYDCYIGQMNVEEKKVKIIRRNSNEETELYSADLPNTTIARGSKHTIEFKCYGTDTPTLQLIIDNTLLANIGDNSSSKLTSGFPGIQVRNGTAYCDTFTIQQYSNDGETPELWTPNQLNTGMTVAAWYIGDEGVTTTGSTVTAWADQSINSNDLTVIGEPVVKTNDVNNHDTIAFPDNVDQFDATDDNSLDLVSKGASIFAVINVKDYASDGNLITKGNSYDIVMSSTNAYKFIGDPSDTATSSGFPGLTNTYQIVGIVTDKDDDTGNGGIFVDGVNTADITFNVGANNDTNLKLGGANFDGAIAEIVVVSGELDQEYRQLVEGYLANKYATTTLLPSDHPYKKYAPIIQN